MKKQELVTMMVRLLQDSLNELTDGAPVQAAPASPLVGPEAIVTSMGLVSFITDVESTLAQNFKLEVTLVSEQALSRRNSPFRSIDVLAEYVLELAGVAPAPDSLAEKQA